MCGLVTDLISSPSDTRKPRNGVIGVVTRRGCACFASSFMRVRIPSTPPNLPLTSGIGSKKVFSLNQSDESTIRGISDNSSTMHLQCVGDGA